MKKLNLLLGLLIGLTILACSSDNNNSYDDSDETVKLYKKASSFNSSILVSTQELFYNSNKQIETAITNIDNGYKITTIDVTYNDNTITRVKKTTAYDSSLSIPDIIEDYDVNISNSTILLTEINGVDYGIQIDFTGEYVDSFKTIQLSDMSTLSEEIFQRNSDNNIMSHSTSDMTFTYSNYDNGNIMPFHREYSIDYLLIFKLKPSNKLPLMENVTFSGGGSDSYTIDSSLLTYDSDNDIINFGDATNYLQLEFIEL